MTAEPIVRDYRLALSSLLEDGPRPLRDVVVTDISQDSRRVVRGGAFLACQGRSSHGLAHLRSRPRARRAPPCCGSRPPVSSRRRLPSAVVGVAVPALARTGG